MFLFFSNDRYVVSRKTGLVWIVIDLMLTIIQSGVAWIFFFLWSGSGSFKDYGSDQQTTEFYFLHQTLCTVDLF